jgi:hypothetical protein
LKANDVKPGARHPGSGLLPLLRALVIDDARFDVDSLAPGLVNRALDNGLGAILARVSRESAAAQSVHADAIQAADLTARLLTADLLETVADIVRVSKNAGCDLVLMKGCSTGVRYYPEPHLRTMGDVDVLVAQGDWPRVEALMRADGFIDTTATLPASWYEQHHHSIPLWQPHRRIWLELHTRLYPPFSPLGAEPRFLPAALERLIATTIVAGGPAQVFAHELQLVYTATRWADMPSFQRGTFPILDAAMLIASHGATLNWAQVCALVDGTWGTTAVRLMLTYLDRWELAAIPSPVLRELAYNDRFANRALIEVLHRLITAFVMEGQPLGRIVTSRNWRTTWSTLVGPTAPWTKPFRLPLKIAWPPRPVERSARERD